jgi:antitoxin component HigA of HigAB toxin-antitoxin module
MTKIARKGVVPFSKIPKTYKGLMAAHMIRPIHAKVDAENAGEMIAQLSGHKLNREQADYLDMLSDVFEKWESEQLSIHEERGGALIKLVLESRGETGRDFAALIGVDPSLASRILNGTRNLTAEQISKVAKHYALNPGYLLP